MAFVQVPAPVAGELGLSAVVAALPLVSMFVMLAVLRIKAHWAALVSLAVALVIAIGVYRMPAGQALSAGAEGASFALLSIMWTVVNAVWIYNMTVESGHFDALRRSFAGISADRRIQAIIVAFCFGALLESVAGFGTPIVISSVMLVALGFRPMKAAMVALVANTVATPFGVLGTPTLTMSRVTGLPVDEIGAVVGRQVPVVAVVVPLVLVVLIDGRRGLRETWPAAVVAGISFAAAQFVCSNYIAVGLVDTVAATVSALALVALLRVWTPGAGTRAGAAESDRPGHADEPNRARTAQAYAPYVLIVAVFAASQLGPVKALLARTTRVFDWPGLDVVTAAGLEPTAVAFTFHTLAAPGTLVLVAGLLCIPILRLRPADAFRSYVAALNRLKWPIVTVMSVLALAYVMSLSGQTMTIGQWMATAGGAFALLSPALGWLGVAATGSNTSSNALFGALQVAAAGQAGLDPRVLAAANMSGGALGTVLSPQNLALVAAVGGLAGREGALLRRLLPWSLGGLAVMSALIWLQTTGAAAWMLP
ncbi:Glycolate permease GlcA [Rhodococcus sp. RD6.2]|uniref:L-lactate permease n=1 Tax=Rhodococcus sp. RD6.2 TaxID=260936 RepID=UPI00063B8640|nr:L-lactate permease [Rhodococcus sp. RD6.2]CRK53261.1 Glycolate permease GlcA [Rhodococcus sp. RD6.2]